MKNKQYSFKDFTGQSFTDRPIEEFSNSTIVGSCFAQETPSLTGMDQPPDVEVFPPDVEGLLLDGCNLDGVRLPKGARIVGAHESARGLVSCNVRRKLVIKTPARLGDPEIEEEREVEWDGRRCVPRRIIATWTVEESEEARHVS